MGKEKHEVLSSEIIRQRFLIILLALTLLAIASGCNFDDFSPAEVQVEVPTLIAEIEMLGENQIEAIYTIASERLIKSRLVFSYESVKTIEGLENNVGELGEVHLGSGTLVILNGEFHLLTVMHTFADYAPDTLVTLTLFDGTETTAKFNVAEVICDVNPNRSFLTEFNNTLIPDRPCLLPLPNFNPAGVENFIELQTKEFSYPEVGEVIYFFNQNNKLVQFEVISVDREKGVVSATSIDKSESFIRRGDSGSMVYNRDGKIIGLVAIGSTFQENIHNPEEQELEEGAYETVTILTFDSSLVNEINSSNLDS